MNKNVLVVDDDAAIRVLVAKILRAQGFRVDFADDGAQALNILENDSSYGVILLDLMMRGMDGFEFIERMRGRDAARLKSTIVMTAAGAAEARRAAEAGIYCAIEKPFDMTDLANRIVECIRHNEAALDSAPG
jgi:DNA-binding response OmpR family regulator